MLQYIIYCSDYFALYNTVAQFSSVIIVIYVCLFEVSDEMPLPRHMETAC